MFDLKTIQKAYDGDHSDVVRLCVISVYKDLFGKEIPNQNCSSCSQDAASQILIKMSDTRKYIVHAHYPIVHKGKVYVQPTLTDEVAEEYLKEHPEDAHKFKRIPKKAAK